MRVVKGRKSLTALALLAVIGGVVWWQRMPLVAWHYVSQLASADLANRDAWVERVVALGEAAVPQILTHLQSANAQTSENLEAALVEIAHSRQPDDPRAQALVAEIKVRFPKFTQSGKAGALQAPIAILVSSHEKSAPAALLRDAGDLLTVASREPDLRISVLQLAGVILERAPEGQWQDLSRSLA